MSTMSRYRQKPGDRALKRRRRTRQVAALRRYVMMCTRDIEGVTM